MKRRLKWEKDTEPMGLYDERWKVTNLVGQDELEVYAYDSGEGYRFSMYTVAGGAAFATKYKTAELAKRAARREYIAAYSRLMRRAEAVLRRDG